MNPQIVAWIKKVCKSQGLSSFYITKRDTYMIHFKGRAVQGFNSQVFWQIPPKLREKQLISIVKLGLNENINLKNRDQFFTKFHLGRKIA